MGTEKYVSEVKIIAAPHGKVYERLSDLENIAELFDPDRLEEMKKHYPNVPDLKLDNFRATSDECSFSIKPVGKVGVRIIEREPSKLIKLSGSQSVPFQFNCWIQLLPYQEAKCKMKITLHAELNTMIKVLVDKHLKEGINRIAEALINIPY